MNLIIDNRENDLIDKLDIEFSKENLLLGDILFQNEKKKDFIIIERKTIKDLIASIKDGRHREQKIRLLNKQKEGTQIYYLYEGDIYHNNNTDLILSCAFNTMIRDNIKVLFSRNIDDTIIVIKKIFKKVIEFQEKFFNNENITELDNTMNYCDTIKSEKKLNMTPKMCYLAMLKQIPGVSSKCALSISNVYNNFCDLLSKYNEIDNEAEKKYLLENIKIEKKRIGKKLSEKIYLYITNNETTK